MVGALLCFLWARQAGGQAGRGQSWAWRVGSRAGGCLCVWHLALGGEGRGTVAWSVRAPRAGAGVWSLDQLVCAGKIRR